MKDRPLLWHFPVSHFNEKVRWALDFKAIPHRRKALGIEYLPKALWATGKPTLPILFLDGKAIGDSTRILEALEERHPEPPLYPREDAARRRAILLEDFFDEKLGHQIRTAILGPMFVSDPDAVIRALTLGMGLGEGFKRMMRAAFPIFSAFYRSRHGIHPATVATAPAEVGAAFDHLEAELGPSGYLAGDAFSVADLTAAALFAPLVMPPELQYPLPGPVPRSMAALRDSVSGRPGFRWVAEMYRRHRGKSAEVAVG
jgi:glutathione S-transferase